MINDHLMTCLVCPSRRPCAGAACACPVDEALITEHAAQLYCPAGRYRLGWGDWVARMLHLTGVTVAVQRLRRSLGIGCGCAARQTWLNGFSATLVAEIRAANAWLEPDCPACSTPL